YITYTDYGSDSRQVTIDEPLAQAYLSALEQLRDRFSLADDISVSLLSRCPEVLKVEQVEEDAEQLWEILRTALDGAVASLIRMREIEGEAMKKALLERADAVEDMIAKIEARAPEVPKEYKAKLTERIIELLGQQTVDESRIAMEVALFADRCSIDEELVRLRSHFVQMRQILGMDQPVGRKLDFLVQEMNREINTI